MGDIKRQHYVPRSYLKRFSFDGKCIHSFLVKSDCIESLSEDILAQINKDISLKDVCVEKDFYTLKSHARKNGTNPLDIEKNFFHGYAENKFKEIIDHFDDIAKKIIREKKDIEQIKITPEQKFRLLQSAFIQYYRTPRFKKIFQDISTVIDITHSLYKKGLPTEVNIDKFDVSYAHANKTYANIYLFRAFLNKALNYSLLLRVSDNSNFYISDHPVVIHKLGVKGKDCLNVNFYEDEFSLFFPLTPYLILELYNPTYFPKSLHMNNTISIVNSEYENQVNKYQYINSEKFVFSYKNDFSLFLKPVNNGKSENAEL